MEISAEAAAQLLSHPKNFANSVHFKPLHNGGRSKGAREIPPLVREIIAISAHHDTIAQTAETFGVSPSTVAQAKKGNVGVNRHDPELAEAIEEHVKADEKQVREKALETLASMFATSITPQNLAGIKDPLKAVAAAKDLSTVVEKMTPKKEVPRTAVFISVPRVRDESEYESVEIKAITEAKRLD